MLHHWLEPRLGFLEQTWVADASTKGLHQGLVYGGLRAVEC